MYISNSLLLFHCFRCSSSGHVIKLLSDIGFNNTRVFTELKRLFPYYTFGSRVVTNKEKKANIYDKIDSIWKQTDPKVVKECLKYLNHRYGNLLDINWIKFLIFPSLYKDDNIALGFYNHDDLIVSYRVVTASKIRYIIPNQQEAYYYFQPLSTLTDKQNIVITEGPFDVISFYLFSGYYNEANTFFISALGKKYVACIKWLLLNSSLFYQRRPTNIIFVLDEDVVNWQKYYYSTVKLINTINLRNINISIIRAQFDDVDKFCSYEVIV